MSADKIGELSTQVCLSWYEVAVELESAGTAGVATS